MTAPFGEKAKWELYKDAVYCFKQILEAAPHKTAVIWLLASHLTNNLNKTNKISQPLLEKFSSWIPHLDIPVSADQQKPTFINSEWTLYAISKTCQKRQMIRMNGEREWSESMQLAQLTTMINVCIYINIHLNWWRIFVLNFCNVM